MPEEALSIRSESGRKVGSHPPYGSLQIDSPKIVVLKITQNNSGTAVG